MLPPERFAWFCDCHETASGLVLATGQGYVSLAAEDGAFATVSELVQGRKKGVLASASALVCVKDAVRRAFVLIRRDEQAPVAAGKWQFPAGRLSVGELPLQGAVRELGEEVGLREQGQPLGWGAARIRVGGREVTWLDDEGMQRFRARWTLVGSTVEFFYPMTLEVADLTAVTAYDKEPYGRQVALLSDIDISEFYARGWLAESSAAIWDAAVEEGVAFRL